MLQLQCQQLLQQHLFWCLQVPRWPAFGFGCLMGAVHSGDFTLPTSCRWGYWRDHPLDISATVCSPSWSLLRLVVGSTLPALWAMLPAQGVS